MNLGTAQVIRANARHLPLADNSVDLVVTSPPYFALRSYQDGGEHYAGQIGDEPTPAEFVASLLEVTRECVRVLKPSGSLWVNLGDKYAGGGGQWDKDERPDPHKRRAASGSIGSGGNTYGLRAKSLIGIPWRYALACIDDLGLILRAEVIWSKPNGLPESVTDRVRRSHEVWFHFTLSPRYFSAVDEIREAHKPGQSRAALSFNREGRETAPGQMCAPHRVGRDDQGLNPLGKLPGSVWEVATEPLRVPDHLGIDHFAAFPTEWPKRIIAGWSPAGVCVECGEGRRPVVHGEQVLLHTQNRTRGRQTLSDDGSGGASRSLGLGADKPVTRKDVTITGYACACARCLDMTASPDGPIRCWLPMGHDGLHAVDVDNPGDPVPPTTPAVVLDPFGGTGTTALVAKALGRHGITVDMSADYCRLAQWRTNDRDQLAKVLGIAKTGPADDDQLDLFGEAAS